MTTLPTTAAVVVSAAADLTTSLLRFSEGATKAAAEMQALADAVLRARVRLRAIRRWARGPRRGTSMRRRALHLKAKP